MKTLTKFSIVAFMMTTPLSALAERGSGGTSGGDYLLSVYKLLPKTITVVARYDYPDWTPIKLSQKKCFGGFKCDKYVNEVRFKVNFDLERFVQPGNPIDVQLTGAPDPKGAEEYPLDIPTTQSSFGLLLNVSKFDSRAGVRFLSMFQLTDSLSERKNETLPFNLSVRVDGKETSANALYNELVKIRAALLSQTDLSNTNIDSLRNLALLDKVMTSLSFIGVEDLLRFGLSEQIRKDGVEIQALALASISRSQECDKEIFAQLIAKIKHWDTGSARFVARLRREIDWPVSDFFEKSLAETRKWALGPAVEAMLVCDGSEKQKLELILR